MPFKRFVRYAGRYARASGAKRRAAGAAAAAVAQQFRSSRSYTNTYTKRSRSRPLTAQSDYKVDYVKRKLGRRQRAVAKRKRVWSRKVVRAVRLSTIGSSHTCYSGFAADISSAPGLSGIVSASLYGLNGNATTNANNCNDIGILMYEMDPAAWNSWNSNNAVVTAAVNPRVESYHAIMEFTMRNTGDDDMIAEVYYVRCRKYIPAVGGQKPITGMSDIASVYRTGFQKQGPAIEPDSGETIGAELAFDQLGVTPFQNSLFCRHFVITRRVKYRLAPSQEVSFILSDTRLRSFRLNGVINNALGPATMGVLVQFQGVSSGVTQDFPAGTPALPSKLTINTQRRYRVKYFRDEMTTDSRPYGV